MNTIAYKTYLLHNQNGLSKPYKSMHKSNNIE